MKEIRTVTEIHAPAEVVWQVLTDFPDYPAWNPFVTRIAGDLEKGAQLSLTFVVPPRGPRTVRTIILAVRTDRELRWLGHLMPFGACDGEHFFELEPLHGARTKLIHGERFTGWLVEIIGDVLIRGVQKQYRAMNAALKERAEAITST